MHLSTRRVDENIWSRQVDFICPNVHQVPPGAEEGKEPHGFVPASSTIWCLPVDDTNCFFITIRHIKEGQDRRAFRSTGLSGDRAYRDRQLVPGDYEAQVSQRPIARHALERLASSDRGVTMFRRLLRDNINAVGRGDDPKGLTWSEQPIFSYSNDTVARIPAPPSSTEDTQLMRETARSWAENYIATHPNSPGPSNGTQR